MQFSTAQRHLKAEYIRERRNCGEFNEGLLAHSPDFLATRLRYAAPHARTGPLSAQNRDLIHVAIDASATRTLSGGLAIHTRLALAAGTTRQAIRARVIGVALLMAEMDKTA